MTINNIYLETNHYFDINKGLKNFDTNIAGLRFDEFENTENRIKYY